MTRWCTVVFSLVSVGLAACATTSEQGTLADLKYVTADLEDVYLDDGLDRAAESYRRYLEGTGAGARTPEAMRRLADLQIEQAYGILGSGDFVEMAAPETATQVDQASAVNKASGPVKLSESEQAFERRATQREEFASNTARFDTQLPGDDGVTALAGPREAIETYRQILEQYPNYERNDKVLYQMSRAYDEIGQPDEAMEIMGRLVAEYPYSKYADEVNFRRGEYLFIRKEYFDAEVAYGSVISMGTTSSYYELALYKLGWALYKQELYEKALHNFMFMLDYRMSIGYDFEVDYEESGEHRVADTFRVISLSFSNLGGSEVVDEYFSSNGHRSFAGKIYENLGEFYFSKLRYDDATSVFKSFIELNPYHQASPLFGMRVVEIYKEAGFPILVVESKKDFAARYALDAEYWNYFDVDSSSDVVGFLKANLTDLAGHYHALYQNENLVDERAPNFSEAQRWYHQILRSFPADTESPQINYRLADLLLENENFGEAAIEYERTAYEYVLHEQSSEAGYAAIYAHRQNLSAATGARRLDVKRATVKSSIRFVDTYQDHEQAPLVLGAAADDLYELQEFDAAIVSAQKLIDRYPAAEDSLLRSAWAVVAHSSIDLAEFPNAERAYINVLNLTLADDESRPAVVDGLAAAIYKQGEQANLLEDYRTAAGHFLRIKNVAPTSGIRSAAEYDAAAALIRLEDWALASNVLQEFRVSHPEHELYADVTKQLAYIYLEDGQIERSASEHERIAAEATDIELRREALLTAGELYDEVKVINDAIRVYERYVAEFPRPLDIAMETRTRLAEIHKAERDTARYHQQLENIITADLDAGTERTDRSRYLAGKAALVFAEQSFEQFVAVELVQPFEESLAEKQRQMDMAMEKFESLVSYEVAEVTAAATYYIAETFMEFSTALMESERPEGLSEAEKVAYELVIEEEAFPFEEQAINVHEENFELLAGGIYNLWVQKSLDQLAFMMPGRYAKHEISGGYLGSIDLYAYRMPIAPGIGSEKENSDDDAEPNEKPESSKDVLRVSGVPDSGLQGP